MSLYIADKKIAQISGLVSITILSPTSKFHSDFWDDSPIFMLLGDNHNGTDMRCNESEDFVRETFESREGLILKLMGKSFYQALDKIASHEKPIDYYCESFFPFKLLQKDNYLVLDRANFVNIQEAVMNYLPRKYLACFSRNEEQKRSKCFTKNIRYHLIDVRFSHANFNLLSDDALGNNQMSYESEVMTNLHCCTLMLNEILSISQDSTKAAVVVLEEACNDPMSFARFFYDLDNKEFIERSLVLKQTKKINKGRYQGIKTHKGEYNVKSNFATQMKEFFLEYYQYYVDNVYNTHFEVSILKTKVQQSINEFKEQIRSIHAKKPLYTTYAIDKKCGFVSEVLFNKYSKAISSYLFYLCLPIMDIYFLFRAWKTSGYKAWLSVLTAGELHIQLIRSFLIEKKGYFTDNFYAQSSGSTLRCINAKDEKSNADIYLEKLDRNLIKRVEDTPQHTPKFTHEELEDIFR